MTSQLCDCTEIAKTSAILFDNNPAVELRVISPSKVFVGVFDEAHRNEFAYAAARFSGHGGCVYFTLNRFSPRLLDRCQNQISGAARAIRDTDIEQRIWLLFDFDPAKSSGSSATSAEHDAAIARASAVRDWLGGQGWPKPMFNDSGNGAHLLYRINLPNDPLAGKLIQNVLKSVGARWDDAAVTVDKRVHNASRICKLPGTLTAKGTPTPECPHRLARIIDVPEVIDVVSREQLERLAGDVAVSVTVDNGAYDLLLPSFDSFDVAAWLHKHRVAIRREKTLDDGSKLFELERCHWRPEEQDGGAFVIQFADGNWDAGCHHSKCEGKGRNELRDVIEPGWRDNEAKASTGATPAKRASDPHKLARLFIAQRYSHADGPTLKYWRGEWHRWQHGAWRSISSGEIRAELTQMLDAESSSSHPDSATGGNNGKRQMPKFTLNLLNNIFAALQGVALLSSEVRQPAWLGNDAPYPASELLSARNGLIHLPSLESGVLPPTPRFFSSAALDYDFEINAPEPTEWLRFLGQLWPSEPQSIETLQDWMGYLLTKDTRQQKILLIVGPPRSGKGTITHVITQLLGSENVAGPTLKGLADRFGLSELVGKSVAIISDARLRANTDAAIVERLLTISGEDSVTVDRKNCPLITVKLDTRIMITTNELPELHDASGAFARRIVPLQLKETWLGKEDTMLSERLSRELPGILLWSREGWLRLRKRGRFVEPESSKSVISELNDLSSPVAAFVDECCELGAKYAIPRKSLYSAFVSWCDQQGRSYKPHDGTFGRNLKAAFPSVSGSQPTVNGKRTRLYTGIRLKDDPVLASFDTAGTCGT
jgi:putative DNA primase/helicase